MKDKHTLRLKFPRTTRFSPKLFPDYNSVLAISMDNIDISAISITFQVTLKSNHHPVLYTLWLDVLSLISLCQHNEEIIQLYSYSFFQLNPSTTFHLPKLLNFRQLYHFVKLLDLGSRYAEQQEILMRQEI